MLDYDRQIIEDIIWLRLCQLIINEDYKSKKFKIPIHLALGHESIAVAVNINMLEDDILVCSHRNVHYNLIRAKSIKKILNEYLLYQDGLAQGCLGSMNLANEDNGIIYTSSILGNNLSVAAGIALAQKINSCSGAVFVVTGDGAIEEGSFYESLEFAKSNNLRLIMIIENNGWSLSSKISERRCPINLQKFCESFDIHYEELNGNNIFEYTNNIGKLKTISIEEEVPVCVEAHLSTLGAWTIKTNDYPKGKHVNYHAGPSPEITLSNWPILKNNCDDPVFTLCKQFDHKLIKSISKKIYEEVMDETK